VNRTLRGVRGALTGLQSRQPSTLLGAFFVIISLIINILSIIN